MNIFLKCRSEQNRDQCTTLKLVYSCSHDILAGGAARLTFCHAAYGGCFSTHPVGGVLANIFASQKTCHLGFGTAFATQQTAYHKKIGTILFSEKKFFEDLNVFSTEISVKSTAGFPDRYGLIQIGSEIILYKSKTLNSFNECVRGFSGIASYEGQLDFEETNSAEHLKTSAVKNLNILFF